MPANAVCYIVKREREDGAWTYLTELDQWATSRASAERFPYKPNIRTRNSFEYEEVVIPVDPSERLRFDVYWGDNPTVEVSLAAAEEIERLRAENERLRAAQRRQVDQRQASPVVPRLQDAGRPAEER